MFDSDNLMSHVHILRWHFIIYQLHNVSKLVTMNFPKYLSDNEFIHTEFIIVKQNS